MNHKNYKPYLNTINECREFYSRFKNNSLTMKDKIALFHDITLPCFSCALTGSIETSKVLFSKINEQEIIENTENKHIQYCQYMFVKTLLKTKNTDKYIDHKVYFEELKARRNDMIINNNVFVYLNILALEIHILIEQFNFYKALDLINEYKNIETSNNEMIEYGTLLETRVLLHLGYNTRLMELSKCNLFKFIYLDLITMILFNNSNYDEIINIINSHYSKEDWETLNFSSFVTNIVLGSFLSDNKYLIDLIKKSWIAEYLKFELEKNKTSLSANLSLFLLDKLDSQNIEYNYPKRIDTIQTRLDLENCFLLILSDMKKQKHENIVKHLALIANFCAEKRIQNNFYPYYYECKWYPSSHISSSFGRLLGLTSQANDDEKIIVDDYSLQYLKNNQLISKLDLSKSFTSINLFKVISGLPKDEFSKCHIHEQLSSKPYNKNEHDNRLYKLLSRWSKIFNQNGIPVPWYLPKNNNLILKIKIELKE